MLLNLQFSNTDSQPNTADLSKQTKINNPLYLFSDIIRLVGVNQSGSKSSFSGQIVQDSSQANFTDILKKFTNSPDSKSGFVSNQNLSAIDQKDITSNINTPVNSNTNSISKNDSANPNSQNVLSSAELQSFLKDLFNQLMNMGFKLTGVEGLAQPADGMKGQNISENNNQITLADLSGNKNNSGKKTKSKLQNIANIGQFIFNLLQSNKSVVLNLNSSGQTLKIDISNLEKQGIINSQDKIGGTASQLVSGTLNSQSQKAATGIETKSGNSVSPNNEIPVVVSLEKLENNTQPGNKKTNVSNNIKGSGEELLKNQVITDLTGNSNQVIGQENQAFTKVVNTQTDPLKSTATNIEPGAQSSSNFNVVITSGNKNYEINGIKDLEQVLSKFITKDNSETKLINDQNNLNGKSNIQNAENKSGINNPSIIKDYFPGDNIVTNNSSFLKYSTELFQNQFNPVVKTSTSIKQQLINNVDTTQNQKQLMEELQNLTLTGKSVSTKAVSNSTSLNNNSQNKNIQTHITGDNSKILNSVQRNDLANGNTDKKSSTNNNSNSISKTAYTNDNKKEVISQSKLFNRDQIKVIQDSKDNKVNTLAGTVQNADQSSKDSNNQRVENNKNTSEIRLNNNSSNAVSEKKGTSGSETGGRSDQGKKQFEDAKISSGQLLNTGKQINSNKEIVNQNLNQFNDVYKTVSVHDLVSEISNFIGNGESKGVTLKLKPGDLGKVKITLEVVNKIVHANIEVDNEAVKQMVQNNINNLRQSLNLNGLQLSSMTVSLSSQEGKSNKSFTGKRKTSRNLISKKIDSGSEQTVSKTLGYNTYEFLI